METSNQILLKKFLIHSSYCPICRTSHGRIDYMCPLGQTIIEVYGKGLSTGGCEQLVEVQRLTWTELALALMGANDDPDPVWITCLDVAVAQKVEVIWVLSEAYWARQHQSLIPTKKDR